MSRSAKCAPVALFVYKRLGHVFQTVESLKKNLLAENTALFVFSDSYESTRDEREVSEVRDYIQTIDGFKSVSIIERERNLGLALSITTGIDYVLKTFNEVIVLEDDMVTSEFFLDYMNRALKLYEHTDEVISIHGYLYPIDYECPETFFIRGANCWGWATWRRGWEMYEPDGRMLLRQLKKKKLEGEFDFNHSYNYTRMLKQQIRGTNDSWAIRWYASAFLREKLTLYPKISLVQNIGVDDSGTHCAEVIFFDCELSQRPITVELTPLQEDSDVRKAMKRYFKRVNKITIPRIFRTIKRKIYKN